MIGRNVHTEEQLLKGCRKYKLWAQKELYELFAPVMRAICIRYSQSVEDAEDVLQEGFMKVFQNIKQFKGNGSLEGWIKRIIINTALYQYKKTKKLREQLRFDDVNENDTQLDANESDFDTDNFVDSSDVNRQKVDFSLIEKAEFSEDELLDVLNVLKDEFRVVFNLFFIEGYKHKQIADMLEIDEKTSRSRLLRARKQLQTELYKRSISKLVV